MPEPEQAATPIVVTFPNRPREPLHERAVHQALGERLATLLGGRFAGDFDAKQHTGMPLYFVPSGTLIGTQALPAVQAESDLFGGQVPLAFIETKAITHPLVGDHAKFPAGWSFEFGRRVADSVLPGYTAFSLDDAREAGRRLLAEGPARVKPVHATGGRGQASFSDTQGLEEALAGLDLADMAECGVVIEANLEEVVTFSVGQVRVGGHVASYYGTQRLTEDNGGQFVYGGSDLTLVAGDFDRLLRLDLPDETRLAIAQAQRYDQAADACYAGLIASRRNYDIAQGIDAAGRHRSGVLEQSWRIGGASSAEIAALEAFAAGAGDRVLRASSIELYGEAQQAPADAAVLFRGHDEDVGFITKCVTVEDYGNA